VAVLTHAALVAAAKNGKLNTLQTHKSLTNIVVGSRVNCTTLSISKEFVQGVVSGTLPDLVVIVKLLWLVHCIVHGSIGRVLGRASIEASWSSTGMLLAIATVGAKGAIRILISTRCSGKCLQVSDQFAVLAGIALSAMGAAAVGLWWAEQDGVVGVSLDVLLEILGALEGLAAEVALMWLQRHVNTDVRGNVVTLDGGGAAVTPLARQIQVVGALAANVTLTNVIIELLGGWQAVAAVLPLADELVARASTSDRGRRWGILLDGGALGLLLRRCGRRWDGVLDVAHSWQRVVVLFWCWV
jgi:hypothetical protein